MAAKDWLFGKRRKKHYYGSEASWIIPSAGLRRERAYVRLLPEQDTTVDRITSPLGQKKKVINFDDGSSMKNNAIGQKAEEIDDDLSSDNSFTELEPQDIDDENLFKEEVDDQNILDFDEKPTLSDELLAKLEAMDIEDEPISIQEVDEKETPDIDDAELKVSETVNSISSAKELAPDKYKVTFTESGASNPVVKNFVTKTPEPPKPLINQQIVKEEDMNDSYYLARDDNESGLVKQLHPDCSVMIPSDYGNALEEIKTCPLDCPYKVLEYQELDQQSLRERLKEMF